MSAWHGARSLIAAGRPRWFPSEAIVPRSAGARLFSSNIHASPLRRCRRHQAELETKKDHIRQYIRALKLGRRRFSTSPASRHGHLDPPKPGEELHVTFIDKDGEKYTFEVAKGDNLLDIAQANDIEMEGMSTFGSSTNRCPVLREKAGIREIEN